MIRVHDLLTSEELATVDVDRVIESLDAADRDQLLAVRKAVVCVFAVPHRSRGTRAELSRLMDEIDQRLREKGEPA